MDLTTLDDEQLEEHRLAVLAEQERRANLATIPETVAELARTYAAGGGNPADLREVLDA